MKFLKHYKAASGFFPSIILSILAIVLAVIGNKLWILAITLSLLLEIFGVTKAKKYYNQIENTTK